MPSPFTLYKHFYHRLPSQRYPFEYEKEFTVRRFYLLAAIIGFAGISGCYWDSELYDTFVADDGNVEHCPEVASIRYYTDKKYDTNSDNQKKIPIVCTENNGIIACEKDDVKVRYDSGSWKPVNNDSNTTSSDKPDDKQTELIKDLAGKRASMALAFKHDICPKNFFCKGDDQATYCTNKEIIVQEVVCGEGLHTCGDNICHDIKTDLKHCGECNKPCPESSTTASAYKCESGDCVPVCRKGYHLVTQTTSNDQKEFKCTPDTPDNCSQLNCTNLAGWDAGECNEGDCVVTKCKPSFYLASDGTCKTHTKEHCGQENVACQKEEKCIYDSEKEEASCLQKTCEELGVRTCPNGNCQPQSDETNCGDDCINCTSIANALNFSCKEGKCAFKCLQGYRPNETGDACECDLGYHKNEDETQCIEDTVDECGSERKKCTYQEICENGSCKHIAQCLEKYDCDRDGKCETSLMDYGLESCEKCGSGYTQCGRTKTRSDVDIPLCLKLEGISENECAAICNYNDWRMTNETSSDCPVDKYISCAYKGEQRYHTKVKTCLTDENLCNIENYEIINDSNKNRYKEAQTIKYIYLDKNALEDYLKIPQRPTNSLPETAAFFTYRVNTCLHKNKCRLDYDNYKKSETKTTNTKPKVTFYPLLVKCE